MENIKMPMRSIAMAWKMYTHINTQKAGELARGRSRSRVCYCVRCRLSGLEAFGIFATLYGDAHKIKVLALLVVSSFRRHAYSRALNVCGLCE